jgi:LAGLIDADG-like domain
MKKLTNNQKNNIKTDYINGSTIKELSVKYNICTWSIDNVLKNYNVLTRIRKYKCNENYFEKIDTNEKSYWLGLLFADGYTRKRRQHNNKYKQGGIVGISLKEGDEYLLNQLIIDIESDYNLHKTITRGFVSYKLEINSRKMTDDLIHHGCVVKKSLILAPPKINKELISNFIRGYIDGDGSIGVYNKRFKLSILGTELMLRYILNYFVNHSIKNSPKISKKGNIHKIQFNSQEDLMKIYELLYNKNCTRFLKRKKEIYNNIKI